jgi:hypothetical protein
VATYYDVIISGTYSDSHTEQLGVVRIDTSSADRSRAQYVQQIRNVFESVMHADPDSGDARGLTSVDISVTTVTV